jgi:hypothetical protein
MYFLITMNRWALFAAVIAPVLAMVILSDYVLANNVWFASLSMIELAVFLLWQYQLLCFLSQHLPAGSRIPLAKIKINLGITFSYCVIISIALILNLDFGSLHPIWLLVLIVAHLYCMYAIANTLYHLSKMVISIERQKQSEIQDSALTFVSLFFFPVTVLFLQKRIHSIVQKYRQ